MLNYLKTSAVALLALGALSTQATTNLLQSVSVNFVAYEQGPAATNANGDVVNIVVRKTYGTKNLIADISTAGAYHAGDVLVRVRAVTNVVGLATNLVAIDTNTLTITNTSTLSGALSNDFIYAGTTNSIGSSNVVFSTNSTLIDGTNVFTGTNTVTIGTNAPIVIGTNLTVTTTPLTNAIGQVVGTNYVLVENAIGTADTGTNKLGAGYFAIYNRGTITPISSNIDFTITRDTIYGVTNAAYVHGETIKANGEIRAGTTDEIRILTINTLSNHLKLSGFAHGVRVAVAVGRGSSAEQVDSSRYSWTGSGSGSISGTNAVLTGAITETYFNQVKTGE